MPDNFFKKQLFSLGHVLNYIQTLKNAKDFDESLALILKTFDNQTLFFNGLSTYGLKVSRKLTIWLNTGLSLLCSSRSAIK
ncbi:MAG: hypothetical protein Q4P13_13225, partial [Psychrobacter sp.]|nr:hypothetical protein [Psychrobacter sp.]